MHLLSLCRQSVTIPDAALAFDFEEQETIWTESSHKYSQQELHGMARHAGFTPTGAMGGFRMGLR